MLKMRNLLCALINRFSNYIEHSRNNKLTTSSMKKYLHLLRTRLNKIDFEIDKEGYIFVLKN